MPACRTCGAPPRHIYSQSLFDVRGLTSLCKKASDRYVRSFFVQNGINSGDMIVIRKQNTASDGDIVVALVDNESTLKRFFLDTERRCVRLHPENLKYPDIYTQNCTVQGVAVHVIKSLE